MLPAGLWENAGQRNGPDSEHGSTGLPIPNVEIHAGPPNGEHLAWERTRQDGTYVLRGMPDGLIEGVVQVTKTVIIRDGRDVTSFDF